VWWDLLWSRVTVVAATIILTISTAIGGTKSRPWIIGSAAFIFIHTLVNWTRDQNVIRRLGREYDRIQRRSLDLVTDLADLAANRYDLWMIDLYLPRWVYRPKRSWPFFERRLRDLSRQLSVSLTDPREQPPNIEGTTWPHGLCFAEESSLIWLGEDAADGSKGHDNAHVRFDGPTNSKLAEVYGALFVAPLVDQLGKHCRGVLAVHVEADPEKVLVASGALTHTLGKRRINNACIEINGLLAK
jgi:hypothetical protein